MIKLIRTLLPFCTILYEGDGPTNKTFYIITGLLIVWLAVSAFTVFMEIKKSNDTLKKITGIVFKELLITFAFFLLFIVLVFW